MTKSRARKLYDVASIDGPSAVARARHRPGGWSVAASDRSCCCENHVDSVLALIEPETSFCDITARRPISCATKRRPATPRNSSQLGLRRSTSRRQKHRVAAYRRIEEHQTSAILLCFFRKLDSELRKLTRKRGSLTRKLKVKMPNQTEFA